MGQRQLGRGRRTGGRPPKATPRPRNSWPAARPRPRRGRTGRQCRRTDSPAVSRWARSRRRRHRMSWPASSPNPRRAASRPPAPVDRPPTGHYPTTAAAGRRPTVSSTRPRPRRPRRSVVGAGEALRGVSDDQDAGRAARRPAARRLRGGARRRGGPRLLPAGAARRRWRRHRGAPHGRRLARPSASPATRRSPPSSPAPTPQTYIDQGGRHAQQDRQEVRADASTQLLAANKDRSRTRTRSRWAT